MWGAQPDCTDGSRRWLRLGLLSALSVSPSSTTLELLLLLLLSLRLSLLLLLLLLLRLRLAALLRDAGMIGLLLGLAALLEDAQEGGEEDDDGRDVVPVGALGLPLRLGTWSAR